MLVENPNQNTQQSFQQKDSEFTQQNDFIAPQLASRFKRFLALFINNNGLVLWGWLFLVVLQDPIVVWVALVSYLIIQIYFMKTYGQTLAKYWLKLKVLDYATRQPLPLKKYILREMLDGIFGWLGFPVLISLIMVFANNERRSLTDLLVSTIVVSENKSH